MTARPAIIASLLLLVASTGASAALMSPQDLLTACSGNGAARATCDGYLMATVDLVLQRESNGRGNGRLCVPQTVTVDQVRDAVLKLGQQGRAMQAPVGLRLVAAALRRTWPCEDPSAQPGGGRPWRNRMPDLPGAPKDQ